MNEITLNDAQLAAEADAALAAAPPVAPVPGMEPAAVESWELTTRALMPTVRIGLLGNYEITDETAEELAASLGQCLDQILPGGPAGKYACWFRLAMACTGIALTSAMRNGGSLPPLGLKRAEEPKPAAN